MPVAVVADTEAPTPPCGACRQILWEFGGDLEVFLANLTTQTGEHRLSVRIIDTSLIDRLGPAIRALHRCVLF